MEKKNFLKAQILWLIVPAFAFAVGLVWPSFYWQVIGLLLAIIIVLNTLYYLLSSTKLNDDCYFTGTVGGVAFFLIAAIFTIAYWNHHATRYVIQNGQKQHLYEDCSSFPKGSKVKKVVEIEGYLYKCFDDCAICKQRSKDEKERQEKEIYERQEKAEKNERNAMIDVLLDAIVDLRNGNSAQSVGEELDEYLYDEGYCTHGLDEYDDSDYTFGVPSRYQ